MTSISRLPFYFSGGEPTLRDDLPDIVAVGLESGFTYIQLNTNGIRLADDTEYLKDLKNAGLASVFLQFSGTQDAVHLKLRGRGLAELKRRAIEACGRHDIGVVLVPTLVPGANTHSVDAVLRTAVRISPVLRGVHFQPISYFERCPQPVDSAPRVTLPELMATIDHQSDGMFKAADFRPPGCENAWCSFHATISRCRTVMSGGYRHPALAEKRSAHIGRGGSAARHSACCPAMGGPKSSWSIPFPVRRRRIGL